MHIARSIFITAFCALAGCTDDPRQPYETALAGSHWQLSFGGGQPFLGCAQTTSCMHPTPKLAALPSGDVSGLEPGCAGGFQMTVADSSHPFAEQTSFELSCPDGSLGCSGDDSTSQLTCRWESATGDFCGGCWFDAELVQVD